ncbi:MAG: hypothetical protein CSYNP_00493 [Syntrophus sp. SKADARSKE-3]|nr:hypothetical protein [Syntrophus sp. SKADARSKE-3]
MIAPTEMKFITPNMPFSEISRKYLNALLSLETNQAKELILRAVEEGVSVKDIYLHVFQPVQYEVGWLWESGVISVGREHYCTNATQLMMSMLYSRVFSGATDGRRLLAACVQGELHELGLRMLSDFFEMEGWNTDYMGANTPNESIVSALEEIKYDLLAINVTMNDRLEDAKKLIDAVHASTKARNTLILVGGYTFLNVDSIWLKIGADGMAADAKLAINMANELVQGGRKNVR